MSDQGPIQLYEVLEEEYASLHGKLPPEHYANNKTPDDRVRSIYARIHALESKRAALCISGGGIRSATFALGILRGLAGANLLDKFHYLSTVSGGGYIGSWLTSWIHRSDNDPGEVAGQLTHAPSAVNPEPDPIRHLRDYSSYLSPHMGLLSADTWTLVAVYIRNLLLNWLVLIPLLTGALMIPRLYAAGVRSIDDKPSPPTEPHMLVLLALVVIFGAVAICYMGLNRPSTSKKNNSQSKFLLCCLLPLVLAAILLTIYWAGLGTATVPPWRFFVFGAGVSAAGVLLRIVKTPTSGGASKKTPWPLDLLAALISGGVGGGLLWLASSASFLLPSGGEEVNLPNYVCFALPLVLAAFTLSGMLYVGLISFLTDDEDREWLSRSDAWVLIVIVMWCAICALVLYGPIGVLLAKEWVVSIGGVSGLVTVLAGRSAKTDRGGGASGKPDAGSTVMSKALMLAGPLFIVFILAMLALAGSWLVDLCYSASLNPTNPPQKYHHLEVVFGARLGQDAIVAAGLLVVSGVVALFVNINRFSLHAMYRNRLIRAYLGASNLNPNPNKFTGFDPGDNLHMRELWPGDPKLPTRNSLLHVVNIALNLVSGSNLAWQERKAESFTVTALHSGSARLGYRDSKTYGDGITLGTSMAISGAAASPNMGYHSSNVLAFIMTLFNARLGWWLGNPGGAGRATYKKDGPFWALKPLVAEVFALTDDEHSYVYLSDGGHFENLGVYEMVRRRCHVIVVSDGGQDKECHFGDLGNAVRKIRIDMGVPIEFDDKICIFARSNDATQNQKGTYCAVGTIKYSAVDGPGTDGYLVYIKPAFYGREPRDVYEFAKNNPDFPHQTTADQFFDESQFESYRMLGSYIFSQISQGWPGGSIDDLARYILGQPPTC